MDRPSNIIPFPRKPAPVPASDDDHARRMMLNAAAFAWILIVVGGAAWTFELLATIPKRECNFSVRRPCSPTAQRGVAASLDASGGFAD